MEQWVVPKSTECDQTCLGNACSCGSTGHSILLRKEIAKSGCRRCLRDLAWILESVIARLILLNSKVLLHKATRWFMFISRRGGISVRCLITNRPKSWEPFLFYGGNGLVEGQADHDIGEDWKLRPVSLAIAGCAIGTTKECVFVTSDASNEILAVAWVSPGGEGVY